MRCDRLRVCRFVLVEARTLSYITLWLTLQIEDTPHELACVLPCLHVEHACFLRSVVSDLLVTWLILPVVICLSQRLSHACLSINIFIP